MDISYFKNINDRQPVIITVGLLVVDSRNGDSCYRFSFETKDYSHLYICGKEVHLEPRRKQSL